MPLLERIRNNISDRRNVGPADKARKKFLRFFPRGFSDPKYFAWERGYKQEAHQQWEEVLDQQRFGKLLSNGQFTEIASIAARIESKTNLLFSFEKMAFRDAVRQPEGARILPRRFISFCMTVEPNRQNSRLGAMQ